MHNADDGASIGGAKHRAPTAAQKLALVVGGISFAFLIFALGFIGEPEDDPWFNETNLWGEGDPFAELACFVSDPFLMYRPVPGYAGATPYPYAGVKNEFVLNSLGHRDDEPLPPDASRIRVMALGDSATWGLNLPARHDSYPDQLEAILSTDGRSKFEVFNAGIVGYSSVQGRNYLLRTLASLAPDVVTIYLGNNDPATSGSDLKRIAGSGGAAFEILHHNWFYLLARKAAMRKQKKDYDLQRKWRIRASKTRKAWLRPKAAFYETAGGTGARLTVRVPPVEYEQNLRDMIRIVRDAGARPILLKVPMNLLWPPEPRPIIRAKLHADDFWAPVGIARGYLEDPPPTRDARPLAGHPYLSLPTRQRFYEQLAKGSAYRIEELPRKLVAEVDAPKLGGVLARNNLGVWELLHDNLAVAQGWFEVAVEAASACGGCLSIREARLLHYHVGITKFLQGESSGAKASLLRAREVFPFAMSPDYVERFDAVVHDLEVEWIDLPQAFERADPEFLGSALIHDWVHPNRRGNQIIAKQLAGLIAEGQ